MTVFNREDYHTVIPQLEKSIDIKTEKLNKRIDEFDGLGTRYSNSKTLTTHLPADQDSYVEGATITLPKGVYIISVYLSLTTSATGNQSHSVQLYRKSPSAAQIQTNRKWTPTNNWSSQELCTIVDVTDDNTIMAVRGSSSVATSGTTYAFMSISAVRII